jgi:hypothetical protein
VDGRRSSVERWWGRRGRVQVSRVFCVAVCHVMSSYVVLLFREPKMGGVCKKWDITRRGEGKYKVTR